MFNEPSSPALEDRVISSLVANGVEAFAAALESGLSSETFTDPVRVSAFEVLRSLNAEGLSPDPALLWERLSAQGPIDGEKFVQLTQGGTSLSLQGALRELVELQRVRATKREAQRVIENADSIEERQKAIMRLLQVQTGSTTARTWKKVVTDAAARASQAIAGKSLDSERTISFGWEAFDQRFKPMRRKELVVIAARPSVGKSSLQRQFAESAASDGKVVAMFSLEVGADDVVDGMATAVSGHSAAELPTLHPAEQREFLEALDQLREAPLHIFEDRSLAAIVSRSKSLHATVGLDVVTVDYLGLISDCSPERGETKAQAIGKVTGALKRLAMELDIVVILLAQLNRNSVTGGSREPTLSDLRDSGDVEQDADRVLLIHRPDTCPFHNTPQDVLKSVDELPRFGVQLIQAKGRNVGTGYAALWFKRKLARFERNGPENRAVTGPLL